MLICDFFFSNMGFLLVICNLSFWVLIMRTQMGFQLEDMFEYTGFIRFGARGMHEIGHEYVCFIDCFHSLGVTLGERESVLFFSLRLAILSSNSNGSRG